jgi:DNA-binding NarL/FixJ family response regulator
MKLRVVLGEDNYLAREAIVSVLERAEDIELVATSRDFDSLLEVIARERPDVVLTDIESGPRRRRFQPTQRAVLRDGVVRRRIRGARVPAQGPHGRRG